MTAKFAVSDGLYHIIDRRMNAIKDRLNRQGGFGSSLNPERVASQLQEILNTSFDQAIRAD